jgi:hypothetical protein
MHAIEPLAISEMGAQFFGKTGMGSFLEEKYVVLGEQAGTGVLAVILLCGSFFHLRTS